MIMIKIGTLFSGIGAPEVALNFIKEAHCIVYACDNDIKCKETYQLNHSAKYFYNDILEVKNTKHKIDLLIFGFPCQSFSKAGNNKALDDERGKLVFTALDILDKQKPKYFIAENVAGLLSHKEAFKKILLRMKKNYKVYYKILDSLNFGLAQRRKRIWFVGIRKDIKQKFKFPEGYKEKMLLKDVLDKNVKDQIYFATKEFLKKDKVKKKMEFCSGEYIPCITHTIARNGSSGEYISYVASVYNAIGETRKPTPEECLKLFGFEDFKFSETITLNQKYRQIGNTMAVPVIKEILKELLNGKR